MNDMTTIEGKILIIRGQQVMLDRDLAGLYGVETKNINKAMSRNKERFPINFCFQLTTDEFASLRFQNGTSNKKGDRRYLPFVFTEQGVAMLSTVLSSDIAIEISLKIMDAFVSMRKFILSNAQVSIDRRRNQESFKVKIFDLERTWS
ncbi:MAG: ORF6N domain-containing protein [Spirochaetia bacterium]|nr:ORF6N domain-containing protein [Spirochaetia bacterium]